MVVIWTVGGTISGYCATGRMASAPSPTKVTKTLRTVAKMGRSMKIWATRMVLFPVLTPVGGGVVMDCAVLRGDLGAGDGVHQAIDDHAVARSKARSDDPQPAAQIPGLDELGHNGAVRGDRHDHMLRLIEHDRGVRQE